MRRPVKIALAGILALAAGIGVFLLLRRPPTAEQVALQYRDCLRCADAECVASLMQPGELEASGMSREDLRRFLKEWIQPRYDGPMSANNDVNFPSSAEQMFTWRVQSAKGMRTLSIQIAPTDAGLRVVNALSAPVVGEMAAGGGGNPVYGAAKLQRLSIEARRLAPELARYNFRRMTLNWDKPPMTLEEFATWRERALREGPPR